ncbi:MAG: cupin domain-containing protein [Candidatus Hodarchaeales archaeon]|jgi:mannose-6-phosphate isomerase-like protein (cupin superfamily)
MIKKVNITEKFSLFSEYWSPKVIGEINDQYVKVVKFQDEFVWHFHEQEDELFLVIKGSLKIKLREKDIVVQEGEFVIIPKGVEHKPVADEEVHVILIEPKETLNTGNVEDDRTVKQLDFI